MPAEWLKLPSLILHERSDLSVLRSLLADLFLATFEFSLNSPALLERAKFTRAVLMSFIFFDDSQKSAEEDFSTVNVYVPRTWSLVHADPSCFCDANISRLTFQLRTRLIPLLDAGVTALPLAHSERVICNLAVRPNQSSQTADSFRFNRVPGSSRPIRTSASRQCRKIKCTVGGVARGGGWTVKMKEAPSRCKDPATSLRTTRAAGRR